MIGSAVLVWFGLLVLMVTLGALREGLLQPRVGERTAHQIGSLAGCLSILIVAYFFVRAAQPDPKQALLVGAIWLALTLAFEFGFFHYARKAPWSELLADYRIHEGRLWVLVLLTTLLGPWLAALVR